VRSAAQPDEQPRGHANTVRAERRTQSRDQVPGASVPNCYVEVETCGSAPPAGYVIAVRDPLLDRETVVPRHLAMLAEHPLETLQHRRPFPEEHVRRMDDSRDERLGAPSGKTATDQPEPEIPVGEEEKILVEAALLTDRVSSRNDG
jgi:hypothetical protein